jgi:8-oxo-dGTP pyrophosphatase MutT (NUDIX family)
MSDSALGAMIAVYRRVMGGVEYLILHRGHAGPAYEGEWAWGPPGGSREPGESIDACAARELCEETGLEGELTPIPFRDPRWAVYVQEVPPDAQIRLSEEHDRFLWLTAEEALALVSPEIIVEELRAVIEKVEGTR